MSLIVIPTVLNQLLREVDEDTGKRAIVGYAKHAIATAGELPTSYLAILDRIQEFLDGEIAIAELHQARASFLADLPHEPGVKDPAGDVIHLTVNICCADALEKAGLMMRVGNYDVHRAFQTLAKDARAVVAASGSHDDEGSSAERDRRKWEEARWQLIQLVQQLPNPNLSWP